MLMNCATKQSGHYLQSNQLRLVKPRVETNSSLIDSFVTITADLKLENVSIYYTSNGEEPSESSAKYERPFKAYKPEIYKFKAFHPDWKSSEVAELKLYKKGVKPDHIIWHSKASDKYKGKGDNTLINQSKANLNYDDPQWVGFISEASATLKFKNKPFLRTMTISFLNDASSWIFPPEQITVEINGDIATKKTIVLNEIKDSKTSAIETIVISLGTDTESLKIDIKNVQSMPEWHEGKGSKAWLFMDEWMFN
ncbi:hypothetical protein GCM10023163_16220 [Aestuariibaculum suncheonense]